MIRNAQQLLEAARTGKKARLVCAAANDAHTIEALYDAEKEGLIDPILIGDAACIEKLCKDCGFGFRNAQIVDQPDTIEACRLAMSYIKEKKADFIMKGLVETSDFLRTLLDKEHGLPTSGLLNHVMMFDVSPAYDRWLITSDGGMVMYPDLAKKKLILSNTLAVARALDIEKINVSVLCAKEHVNPKMQATVDAAALKEMCLAGEFGDDVYVEGPISLDLALSAEVAEIKRFDSPVCGRTDIAILPNIEAGNLMGKTLSILCGAVNAGVVVGASVPVVLPSRGDSSMSKLCSIALGCAMARKAGN